MSESNGPRRSSLRTRAVVGFVFPFFLALAASWVVHRAIDRAVDLRALTEKTDRTLERSFVLLEATSTAVAGQRGYLLTGNRDFLEPYRSAQLRFYEAHRELSGLVASDRDQRIRLDRIRDAFEEWRTVIAEPSIQRRAETGDELPEEALAEIASGAGQRRIDAVRQATAEFSEEARAKLARTGTDADSALRWGSFLALLVPGLAVGIALAVTLRRVWQAIEGLEAITAAAGDIAAGHSSRRAVVDGDDEIASLASTFNRMAGHLEREATALTEIRRLSEHLLACRSVSEAHEVVARAAPRIFPGRGGVLISAASSSDTLEEVTYWGEGALRDPFRVLGPDDCWGLRKGSPHESGPESSSPRCPHGPPDPGLASLCLPLVARGDAIGVIQLLGDRNYSPHEREYAETVAEQIALSLANLRLQEHLRLESIRDPLTGLFNRRYLQETLARDLRRAHRKDSSVAVILFDVDHFKRFNDTWGHQAGDLVLKAIAEVLRNTIRGGDIACRFGGEEFVVVAGEVGRDGALRLAEKLRESVRNIRVEHGEIPLPPVSLSLGVAVYPEHASDAEALVRAADRAMYRAKREGRDRVLLAEAA